MAKNEENEVRQIDDEELLALGSKVVPTSMIPAIWHQRTGHTFSRTAPLQARLKRRINPMGKNRGKLYFWRDEIERAVISQGKKRGRHSKQNDENTDASKIGA